MKYLNYLFMVLLVLVLLPNTDASYVAGQNTDIRYSVRLDGSPVNALCNITVLDPLNEIIVPFQPMTYDSNTQQHNYTISGGNTSILGNYCFDITCTDSGFNATKHDCITITPAGQEVSSGQAVMYIFMLILCVFIFGLIIYGAMKIESKHKRNEFGEITGINHTKYLKYFLYFLSYFFLMFIVYLGFNVAFAYLYIPFIEKIYLILWNIMILAVYLIVPFYLLYNVIVYINDKKITDLLRRNLPVE